MFFSRTIVLLTKNLVVLAGIAGIFAVQKPYADNIGLQENVDYFQEEKQLKLFTSVQKQIPAFGFNNLAANINYLGYIQYFGDGKARETTGYSSITDYFEIIADRDPRFIQAFLSLSTANSVFAGQPEKTVALIDKSIETVAPHRQKMPDAHYLWNYKGIDQILFLGDIKGAQESYLNSAKWSGERNDEGSKFAASRAMETVNFLAGNPDPRKVQVAGWMSIFSTAKDDRTRERAIAKIKDLGAEITISAQGEVQVKIPEGV
jgi:hypothetical protein